jgi:hypothetical protein
MAGDKSLAVADASGNVGVLRPEGSFVYRTNLLEAAELEKAEALVRQAEKEREALRYPVPRLAPKKVSLRVTESDGIERRDEFVCIGLAALGIAEPFQSAEAQTEGGQALPAQIATTPERDRELLLLLANLEAKGTVSLSVTLRSERDTRGAEGVTLTDFYNHYSVQSGGLRAAFGVVSGEHFFGHFGRMMTLSYGSVSMGCDEFKLEGGSARPEGFRVETGPVAVRVWSRVLSSSLPGRMVLDRIYDCLLGGRIEERISISCTESFAKAPADRAMEKKTTAVIEAVETTGKEEEKDEADNAMKKETESRRLTVKKEALIEEIIKTVGFSRTDTVGGNAVSFRDKRKAPPTWCAVAGSDARSQILVFYPQSASELGGDIVDEQGRLRIGASFAAHETWSRTLRIVYASGDSPGTTDRDQFLQRLRRSLRCELAK